MFTNFDVLLTVHLSIFISVFNQSDAQNLFRNKFYASGWLNTEIKKLNVYISLFVILMRSRILISAIKLSVLSVFFSFSTDYNRTLPSYCAMRRSQLQVRKLSFELDARRWLSASVNHDAGLPSDVAYDLVKLPVLVPTALLSCPNMKMVSRCVIMQTHLWRSLCMDCRPRGHGKAPPQKRIVNSVMRLRLGQPAQHTCVITCIRIAWACPLYIVRDASVMLPAFTISTTCVYGNHTNVILHIMCAIFKHIFRLY